MPSFSITTTAPRVERHIESGNDILLEIDWQGARQIKQHRPDAVSLYILPPSYLILEERLRARGDSPANIQRRMRGAYVELSHYDEYDYLVINENLDSALAEIEAIITAARNNYCLHRPYYDGLIKQLLEAASIIQ
jgi:guanylate kinase